MPSSASSRPLRETESAPTAIAAGHASVADRSARRADPDSKNEATTDPDPRLTFANERTLLAWQRTALALIAGGLAVTQFLKAGFSGAPLIAALPMIALGATLSVGSFRAWQRNQQALRHGRDLPPSALPNILFYGVATVAVAAAALALLRIASH